MGLFSGVTNAVRNVTKRAGQGLSRVDLRRIPEEARNLNTSEWRTIGTAIGNVKYGLQGVGTLLGGVTQIAQENPWLGGLLGSAVGMPGLGSMLGGGGGSGPMESQAPPQPPAKPNRTWIWVAAGAAVLGLLAFLLLRKKG